MHLSTRPSNLPRPSTEPSAEPSTDLRRPSIRYTPLDEAVVRAVERGKSTEVKRRLYGTILLVGGGAHVPGLAQCVPYLPRLHSPPFLSSTALSPSLSLFRPLLSQPPHPNLASPSPSPAHCELRLRSRSPLCSPHLPTRLSPSPPGTSSGASRAVGSSPRTPPRASSASR